MERLLDIVDSVRLRATPPPPGEIFVAEVSWDLVKATYVAGTQNVALVARITRTLPVDVYIQVLISGASTAVRDTDYVMDRYATPPEVVPSTDLYLLIRKGQTAGALTMTVLAPDVPASPRFADFILTSFQTGTGADLVRVVPSRAGSTMRAVMTDAPVSPPGSVAWSFETDAVAFNEDAPPATTRVRVNFAGPLPGPVVMRFYTANGTATAGTDYVAINATGTLPEGSTTFSIPIQLINDTTAEGAETFTLTGEVISGPAVNGASPSITITINASDQQAPALLAQWDFQDDPEVSIVEGAPRISVGLRLSSVAAQNIAVPVTVRGLASAPLSRVTLLFAGGVYGTMSVQAGQQVAQLEIFVPNQNGVQPTMTYELEIESGTGVEPGALHTLTIEVLDSGSNVLPRVGWREPVQALASEGGADLPIVLRVENPAAAFLGAPFSVDLQYGGTASYGSDYRIFQTVNGQLVESPNRVTFEAFAQTAVIFLRPTNDVVFEPQELYTIELVSPTGCEVGTVAETSGSLLDNDVNPTGEALRPQFYFASEVFGRGAVAASGNVCNMVVDLGVQAFGEDVLIDMDWYSPNAAESTDGGTTGDFWFPDGKQLRIPAGQQYGTLRFQALPDGLAGTQKRVIVEMVGTSHGRVDTYPQQRKWCAVLLGGADNRGLVPTPFVPATSLDDFEVYADRIEDLYHGITIPLPYSNSTGPHIAVYGQLATMLSGSGNERWNGVGVAAHLAQKVWLERNGLSSFGVRKVYDSGIPGQEEVHYIEPHVKWLDEGLPVYISVYEQATNGPHNMHFAGQFDPPTFPTIGTIAWGRHLPTGTTGVHHPSCTRDLYITARSHKHTIREANFGNVMRNTSAGASGEQWHKQCFVDNLHLINFGIAVNTSGDFIRKVHSNAPPSQVTFQPVWNGLVRFDGWEWTSVDVTALPNNFDFHVRMSGPGSWVFTRCAGTRSQRQFFYLDSTGPICILAYNENQVCSGRSFLQLVSRPPFRQPAPGFGATTSGPSHGLVACVENEIFGDHRYGEASDFDVYGHLGYLVFSGNRHRGELNVPGAGLGYNRRMYALLSSGDQEGTYVANGVLCDLAHQFHPGSPVGTSVPAQTWFMFRDAEIEDIDMQLDAVGVWGNCAVDVSGCFRFTFKPVIAATGPSMNTFPANPASGLPFFNFNVESSITPKYTGGSVLVDPLGRPVAGGPFGPEVLLPNRGGLRNVSPPGAISFPSGFDASLGGACGSTRLADHHTFLSTHTAALNFNALTLAARNAYSGVDP